MQENEIAQIVKRVVAEMSAGSSLQIDGEQQPLLTAAVADPEVSEDQEISDAEDQIVMLQRIADQLKVAVRSVIPDEEPHDYVLLMLTQWIDVAKAAQAGSLIVWRDSKRQYSEDELQAFEESGMILERASDIDSLYGYRSYIDDMTTQDASPESFSEKPEEKPVQLGYLDSHFYPLRREMIEHAVTGAISGGLISLLVGLLTFLAIRG